MLCAPCYSVEFGLYRVVGDVKGVSDDFGDLLDGSSMRSAWVYLVALTVLVTAALFIFRLRSSEIPDEAAGIVSRLPTLGSLSERTIEYQAVGPDGISATVSYLDDEGHNQNVDTVLPWQESLRTVQPSLVTSMVVQSNGSGVGCRITVDGKVRDEQFAAATGGIASCKVQVA